jgi:hypothetical protein
MLTCRYDRSTRTKRLQDRFCSTLLWPQCPAEQACPPLFGLEGVCAHGGMHRENGFRETPGLAVCPGQRPGARVVRHAREPCVCHAPLPLKRIFLLPRPVHCLSRTSLGLRLSSMCTCLALMFPPWVLGCLGGLPTLTRDRHDDSKESRWLHQLPASRSRELEERAAGNCQGGREFLLLTSKEEQNYGVLGRTERSCASQSRTNESKQEENN